MNKPYDKEQINCTGCGHRWILISDIEISDMIHELWLIRVWQQHVDINMFPKGDYNEEEN